MEVIFDVAVDVNETALPCGISDSIISPTLPAAALSFVVVPIIPEVDENVMLVAEAAPSTGVTSVGDVANTSEPLPVSFVTVAAKFALLGVAKNVAMFAARPLTPVEIGNPVQFVKVPEVGVPRTGVTSVGLVAKTNDPVPVSSVIALARLALLGVPKNVATPAPNPLMPVLIGNPVQFVNVPDVGVPNNGVTNVGDVAKTLNPVPVLSVKADPKLALDGVPKKVATPVPRPLTPLLIGSPVQFVKVPDVGVPNNGVTKVGDVANTKAPVPVSSVIVAARFALVGVARNVAIFEARPLTPVEIGRPVQFVKTPLFTVPRDGVTNTGESDPATLPVPVCPESVIPIAFIVAITYPYATVSDPTEE